MTTKLQYGAHWLVPDNAPAAWGARLIIDQDGRVEIVWDRTDSVGKDEPRAEFIAEFSKRFPTNVLHDTIERMLRDDELSTREDRDVVLYDDDVIRVAGNPRKSAGYFYIAAWAKGATQ